MQTGVQSTKRYEREQAKGFYSYKPRETILMIEQENKLLIRVNDNCMQQS